MLRQCCPWPEPELSPEQRCGWVPQAFDACDPICKADFSRLGFMYVFGGVYADMDFEALRSFDALVDPPESPEGGGVANELL